MSGQRSWRGFLRVLLGALVLALTLHWIGARPLAERLSRLDARLLWWSLPLGALQLLLCAARWRATAGALGLPLTHAQALREYGLTTFMNVSLPLGVVGDATRAIRHAGGRASAAAGLGPALRVVLIERASGQLVVVLAALLALPAWGRVLSSQVVLRPAQLLVPFGCAALMASATSTRLLPSSVRSAVLRFWSDARRALFSRKMLATQLGLSSALLLTLLAQLFCALSALGMSLPAAQAARIVPFMLLSMALPLSIAGFGAREAATASLYQLSGLQAADGVAFALAYGLIAWTSSLPGLALFLASTRTPTSRV